MLERVDESLIARKSFVPPTKLGGDLRGNEDFVDGCVKSYPGESLGEGARVLCKKLRPIRVLKVSYPIGHAEVAEVRNRRNLHLMKRVECVVRETPVVAGSAFVRRIVGRAIAQERNP